MECLGDGAYVKVEGDGDVPLKKEVIPWAPFPESVSVSPWCGQLCLSTCSWSMEPCLIPHPEQSSQAPRAKTLGHDKDFFL